MPKMTRSERIARLINDLNDAAMSLDLTGPDDDALEIITRTRRAIAKLPR